MDLVPICVVGFITLGIYKFLELLICRRERLTMIERLSTTELVDYMRSTGSLAKLSGNSAPVFPAGALKWGCLLLGLGIGLLFAFMLTQVCEIRGYDAVSSLYAGSLLCFGGLGLIVAFIVERLLARKK